MFTPDYTETFQIFSIEHLIPVLIIFSIITLLMIFKDQIKNTKLFDILRYTLAALILLQELSLNIYRIILNEWQIATSLPLQLCGLAVLTTAYVLISKNEKLFQKVVFIMFIGAFMALVTPGIEYNLGYPNFRYYQFFISHGLIVINLSYILFIMDYQKNIKYRHLLDNFFSLVLIALVMLLINLLTGGNYLYLMAKPGPNTAFDLFGEHPWYLLNILIFGVPILFHLFYLPFFIRNTVFRKKLKIQKAS